MIAESPTLIEIVGPTGIRAELTNLGARLTRLMVTDATGRTLDVSLGFDTLAEYAINSNLYFGATVGRVANRTANATFSLDGATYQLAANDGAHHLHGGIARSFDRVVWNLETTDSVPSVEFTYASPHLEEGYPGNLDVTVIYTLTREGGIRIDYQAVSDRPTPVNLTNHTYWNLGGNASQTIDDHLLTVLADSYTPTDTTLIPLGAPLSIEGTPLDFRDSVAIGPRAAALADTPGAGVDHNLVLSTWDTTLQWAARLKHPSNGLVMDLHTTEPAIQIYSGGHMPPTTGKGGVIYPTRGGICLEAQHFPDSLHHPEYPTVLLQPGETYRQTTEYRFLTL